GPRPATAVPGTGSVRFRYGVTATVPMAQTDRGTTPAGSSGRRWPPLTIPSPPVPGPTAAPETTAPDAGSGPPAPAVQSNRCALSVLRGSHTGLVLDQGTCDDVAGRL